MYLITRKVSSFSMIELLVVLILSSIIVGIIYFSFYNISRYQINLSNRLSGLSDLNSLNFLLKEDFDRSKSILMSNDRTLNMDVPKQSIKINYLFSPSFIVRKQNSRIDTFNFKTANLKFLWQGKEIDKALSPADELQVDIWNATAPVTLSVYKAYDAASLIETIKSDSL